MKSIIFVQLRMGGNEIDNLVTACSDCNRGKGLLFIQSPKSLEEKAELVREQEAQIRAYYERLEAKKTRKDDETWSIADIFMDRFSDTDIQATPAFQYQDVSRYSRLFRGFRGDGDRR